MRISDWSSDVCSSDLKILPCLWLHYAVRLNSGVRPHGKHVGNDRQAGSIRTHHLHHSWRSVRFCCMAGLHKQRPRHCLLAVWGGSNCPTHGWNFRASQLARRISHMATLVLALVRPNNAFKPKPLRSAKHMAGTACPVFSSTTRPRLTYVLRAATPKL